MTFRDYVKGVRRIQFTHIGKDRQFWAGHYGTKMARACIKFLPPSAPVEPNSQGNRLTSVDMTTYEPIAVNVNDYLDDFNRNSDDDDEEQFDEDDSDD